MCLYMYVCIYIYVWVRVWCTMNRVYLNGSIDVVHVDTNSHSHQHVLWSLSNCQVQVGENKESDTA